MATDDKTPIANDYLEVRAELGTALFALLALARETNAAPDLIGTLQTLQGSLREPFLFLVAGEAGAGKSSLLNALFGREFCPVDVPPATARVHVYRYGEPARDVTLADGLVERYLPAGFLRDFNVVDPPGTNTAIGGHEAITGRFAPQADLILFVFSVVNPWGASAWQFLEGLQHGWRRKVVVVLQGADLRGEGEVQAISQHLRQTAAARLGWAFPVFAVSAKQAFLSKTSGVDKARLWRESRLGPLEDHINEIVAAGEGRRARLRSVEQAAQGVLGQFVEQTGNSRRVAAANRAELDRVRPAVAEFRGRAASQVEAVLRGIDTAFARCQHQGEHLLRQRLRLWPSLRLLGGPDAQWQGEFQRNIESMLRAAVTRQTEHALGLLEGESQTFWAALREEMLANLSPGARQQLTMGTAGFADQRARLIEKIELALVENLADERTETRFQASFAAPVPWMRLVVAALVSGGVGALLAWQLGTVSAAVAVGGLAVVVALAGAATAAGKRRGILDAYREQMTVRQEKLTATVGDLVRQAIDAFYERITHACEPVAAFCDRQEEMHRPLLERVESLQKTFHEIAKRL